MARTPTSIVGADGKRRDGYIDNGKTYYSSGKRIENGATVTDNSGREWRMTDRGGVQTGNNYSPSGNQGAYRGSGGGSGGRNYGEDTYAEPNYYDTYKNLLDQQRREQERAIERQTQATVDSINAYRPKVEQSYADQQKANYIANAKNQSQMGDYLGAMGYSGGMAESTMADLSNTYQNNRMQADTQKNNAMLQLDQQVAQARSTGDASLANAANSYYTNYLSALQNQQQFDYQKQLQEQENYANTIGAYSNDYMAQINQLKAAGVPEDDYRLRVLYAARNQKIANQKSSQAEAEQQDFENYIKQQNLALNQARTNYTISRPYSSGSTKKYTPSQIQFMFDKGWIDEATARSMLGM